MDARKEIERADALLSKILVCGDDTYKMVSARQALKRAYDELIKQEVQNAAGTCREEN